LTAKIARISAAAVSYLDVEKVLRLGLMVVGVKTGGYSAVIRTARRKAGVYIVV
jgi:hypothetical protein